ncbi:uncharacterized protein LOC134835830 [Culicoides brevitarsis]|uniref:uncharacterized protein LOC134835830 n=1 Tax=Culicoides brevitarsis TaxID=469753 RepID=UPI00307C02EC
MSTKEEEMDSTMSKIFETLNLNSLSTEMHNLSLNELKSSLTSLGQFVIVGKFDGETAEQQNSVTITTNGDSEATSTQNGEQEPTKKYHDEKIFNLSCRCAECTKHRETVIQLYLEDAKYNELWERLQKHLLSFYDIIPQSPDSAVFKKYKELMEKSHTKWLSDGSIDLKNNFRLSLGSYLPLTDEMIFTLLCNRDPHQLFELICIQMQAVVLAYTEGLKNILKYNEQKEVVDYCPSDLLNYIFDGYAKICHCEKTLSTIFFDLEAGHLLQFNLSLSQVYKRMYHRWIYLELQKLVPECILKLKELDYDDNYTVLVQKFIKFEDAMTSVTQTWRDIWLLIQNYHKSKEDIARRKRINTVHSIFQVIRDSEFDFDEGFVLEDKPLVDWITSEKRNDVWQYVVHNIKTNWSSCAESRLTAKLVSVTCVKCNSPFVPHIVTCECRSCVIAGGPSITSAKSDKGKAALCTKCIFFEKFTNGVVVKRAANEDYPAESHPEAEKDRKLYHLAWAIFKHIPDRVQYSSSTIDPALFCVFQDVPCTRYSCRVAANIITLTYPLNFSKYLIKYYRQLDETTRKKIMSLQMDASTIKNLETRTSDIFSSSKKLHPLHVTDNKWASNGDLSENDDEPMRKASALAEGFLVDFPMPQKNVIFTYFFKLFRIVGSDIEFNADLLDNMKKPNSKFVTSEVNSANVRSRGGDQLEDINIRMNNLKIMNKVVRRDCGSPCEKGTKDGEIKKPLVEALQLAASNKKLEAELRSLQKEHSMLKDMVRDLEHIHEEKHQCNHSEDESSDSRESKSSHRTEGQCICYYCTIFGQNDCSHNSRVNETRDRLRKRLRKMQATTPPITANGKEHKPVTLKDIKMARANANLAKNVKNPEPPKGKRIVYQQTTPNANQIPAKMPVQAKSVTCTMPPRAVVPPTPCPETESVQKITPINCAPVDDILKFIEGDAAKKEKEALAAKKAQKKKQKQRKMEQKKISELEDLKSQHDELSVEEDEIRKSLKLLKKRKNKNRLMQAEERLVELSGLKSELASAASEIIQTIRKTNPNFHFGDFGEVEDDEDEEEIQVQEEPQTPQKQAVMNEQRNCEISVDPSKRMVTIRRINLPHSEPQVTVTAKGASPDKDQLLYTFINGQLVPASPANQQLLQKIKSQASQYTQNYLKPQNPTLNVPPPPPQATQEPQDPPQKYPVVIKSNVKKPNAIQLQKIQQKIQKQQQKNAEMEKKALNNKQQQQEAKSKKKVEKPEEIPKIPPPAAKSSNKKDSKKVESKQEKIETKNNKKNKQKSDKRQSSVEKTEEIPKKEKPKRHASTYIDPEFDNNAFKLLNIDDSESDGDLPSSSEASTVSSEQIAPPPKPENTKTRSEKSQNSQKSKTNEPQKQKNANERKQSTDSSTSVKAGRNKINEKLTNGTKNQGKNAKENGIQGKSTPKSDVMSKNMQDKVNGVSIMEQLSRGVRVEGLTLPPGITLTRIDPAACENIKAKKESINKISQPLTTVVADHHPMMNPYSESNYLVANPTAAYGMPKQDNIIMVETPQLATKSVNGHSNDEPSKKSRRRRKKKTAENGQVEQKTTSQPKNKRVNNENVSNNNMVTLKNPMFDSVSQTISKKAASVMSNRAPIPSYDQPAAIIKNENGMFTIRNPALHQAISHGQVNTLPHYSTYSGANNGGLNNGHCSGDDVPYTAPDAIIDGDAERKCNSVIGSEIKTAHQIKQAQQKEQQHWGDAGIFGLSTAFPASGGNSNKCYSPFEPNCQRTSPGGFNSDFFGRMGDYPKQNYFATNSHFSPRNNFSPELGGHSNYYDNGANSKYDDTSFLQSLQPGQRLNSEVTIHNINEAKFLRDQHADSNGIEITRIQTPGMDVTGDASHTGERITLNELLKNTSLYQNKQLLDMAADSTDFSDNLFSSRTTDSPFNNHFYDAPIKPPPSSMKGVIGLNRAPGSKSKSSDSPSSSLFGEFSSSLSMSSSNTPPSADDPLVDFGSNSDPIYYDTNKNGSHGLGVIGGEIKAVQANID